MEGKEIHTLNKIKKIFRPNSFLDKKKTSKRTIFKVNLILWLKHFLRAYVQIF